jgi:serine/threonine protein kinase
VQREVESLLAHDKENGADGFLEAPVLEIAARHLAQDNASATSGEFKGTERFLVQHRLGSGGFGTVYKVWDSRNNSVVALKTLNRINSELLYRFKREFRELSDIVHPNLVTLYQLMSDGEQWFFTMEFVDGINFLHYVQGRESEDAPGGLPADSHARTALENHVTTVDLDSVGSAEPQDSRTNAKGLIRHFETAAPFHVGRLRSSLKQLAEGVYALHGAGKLHRDLKPSNVLVSGVGRVAILDFGLIMEISEARVSQDAIVIGTPAYMSPEQAAGIPLSEASDWYSVGVMLYEALTGRSPFQGQSLQLLAGKRRLKASPPSALVSGIPEDLDVLCSDLLLPDPRDRPPGRQVLDRLGAGADRDVVLLARTPPQNRAPFIGRQHHLALLAEAFDTVKTGSTVAVHVYGASGIGKSALVHRFLEQLRQREKVVVLTGRCYERESVPYKAFDSLVDSLAQYLNTLSCGEVQSMIPHELEALAHLFPVLEEIKRRAGLPSLPNIPDRRELRRRAFAVLRELLARLTARAPVLLFIDDLQWGDVDSAFLLSELLRPPDSPALLFIASYRAEDVNISPFLRAFLPLQQTSRLIELPVKELSCEEAESLALRLTGDGPISLTAAEAIALRYLAGATKQYLVEEPTIRNSI